MNRSARALALKSRIREWTPEKFRLDITEHEVRLIHDNPAANFRMAITVHLTGNYSILSTLSPSTPQEFTEGKIVSGVMNILQQV